MKSLLYFGLLYTLCSGILACFEERPLEPSLQQYLALNKNCEETLFPQPSCCGVSTEPAHRIINGAVTGRTEFTWTVHIVSTFQSLVTSQFAESNCGGSLINPLWVISAAHCFVNKKYEFLYAKLHIGEWNTSDTLDTNVVRVVLPTENFIIHPRYTEGTDGGDLALVRLEHPVAYTAFINPICLPFNQLKNDCLAYNEAVATGWGHTSYEGELSSIKLKTTLIVMEKCVVNIPDYICVTSDNGINSACNGDSGGPLNFKIPNSAENYLLGIATDADNCTTRERPNYFTKVDMKWVLKVILNDYTKKQY